MERNTVRATSTVIDIEYRTVLMNLAKLSRQPAALPDHADLADGVVQINDRLGFGQSGGFTSFAGGAYGFGITGASTPRRTRTDVPSPGWFHVGRKRKVPSRACYVGCYGDSCAWVLADGIQSLSRFTRLRTRSCCSFRPRWSCFAMSRRSWKLRATSSTGSIGRGSSPT